MESVNDIYVLMNLSSPSSAADKKIDSVKARDKMAEITCVIEYPRDLETVCSLFVISFESFTRLHISPHSPS